MLLDFAVEGLIGQETKEIEGELARREASLSIELDGERLGFRESAVAQANEPDPARRGTLEQARLEVLADQLGPLYEQLVETQHATAAQLGYDSYRKLCAQCKGFDLAELHRQTAAFSAATESAYPRLVEPELARTLGIGLGELRRADLPRLFRAADDDRHFPAQQLVSSLRETLAAAHVDPSLPFEFRYLGDNAITEAFAFLLEHLVDDPVWLARRLGVDERAAAQLAAHARAVRLIYLRRYAAKLAYELELHGDDDGGDRGLDALSARYAQLLSSGLQVQWPREPFLADVDPGFYCSCYLRAWALETHLRAYLRERFGPAWFESAHAGAALRELWREGQRLTPDELLAKVSPERLEFGVMLADLGLE